MNVTLLLVLLVVFSYGVGHLVARYASRFLVFSGAEYLLVGLLVGPQVAPRLLSAEQLAQLAPLVSLLLGLVGFIFGTRASRDLRRLDATIAGVVSSLGVIVLVAAAVITLAGALMPGDPASAGIVLQAVLFERSDWQLEIYATSHQLWLGVALGCAAAVSSTTSIELTARLLRARGRTLQFLSVCAAASQITAVIVYGLTLAAARGTEPEARFGLGVMEWAVTEAGAGVVCGLLFSLFIGRESDPARTFLAAIGCVIFASGLASALGISPLFVNLVAGAVVAGTSPHRSQLTDELSRLRHPIFVLVMIFAGALWIPAEGILWLFPLVYMVVRFIARRALTAISERLFLEHPLRSVRPGDGLLGQGTLAAAIGVSYAHRFPEQAPVALSTVLLATLLFDAHSVRGIRRVLVDAGEVGVLSDEDAERHSIELSPTPPPAQPEGSP